MKKHPQQVNNSLHTIKQILYKFTKYVFKLFLLFVSELC